ncbi:MAG: hypothetical protein Q8S73_37070 [Deltaproteobacteria bacterium]|nr:hypothetical protein [Myxococcales bacterium]MDP3219773.1 hypothetical protein [Deltaproteobacteria bacterium]
MATNRVEAECPECKRSRQVRGDGTFAQHSESGFFGGSTWTKRPCPGSGESALAALRAAKRSQLLRAADDAAKRVESERPRYAEAKKWMDDAEADLAAARAAVEAFDAEVA